MLADLHDAIAAVAPIIGVEQYYDGTYGIQFKIEATEQQRSAALAIVSSWQEPAERRLVYSLEFLDRFPESTQLAVVAAAQQSPVIRLWYDRLIANGSVDLDSPRLRAGLQTMLEAGLLTQAEIDAALA
jgi:hypothetical protein